MGVSTFSSHIVTANCRFVLKLRGFKASPYLEEWQILKGSRLYSTSWKKERSVTRSFILHFSNILKDLSFIIILYFVENWNICWPYIKFLSLGDFSTMGEGARRRKGCAPNFVRGTTGEPRSAAGRGVQGAALVPRLWVPPSLGCGGLRLGYFGWDPAWGHETQRLWGAKSDGPGSQPLS